MANRLKDFTINDKYIKPPNYQGEYERHIRQGEDEARYILLPDHEFDRPWIASPQGNGGVAFVWPLGVEGFEFNSNATAGIHHYIGDNDVYVDVVYPDELHVILNGVFPGDTSPQLMALLRQVILHQADTPGNKLLSMPPASGRIQHVKIVNHSFTRDPTDNFMRINYSIEGIRTGLGVNAVSTIDTVPDADPTNTALRGTSSHKHTVKANAQSLHELAQLLYGNGDLQSMIQLWYLNEEKMERWAIPLYKVPYAVVDVGKVIYY